MAERPHVIHVSGRSPSPQHIAEQRREQLAAIRFCRSVAGECGRRVRRDPRVRLSEARGLPTG
jgi:hypothetical protein